MHCQTPEDCFRFGLRDGLSASRLGTAQAQPGHETDEHYLRGYETGLWHSESG